MVYGCYARWLVWLLIRIVIGHRIKLRPVKYALEMVVRVLVLELIPLTAAAAFVALRCTCLMALELAEMRARGASSPFSSARH
jgi:phospholipid/cholesterol/gamma-HCH transport system permease protein